MSLGIRAKLWAGFGACAICTLVLATYVYVAIGGLADNEQTLADDVFGGTLLLAQYLDVSWASRSDVQGYLLADDPAQRAEVRSQVRKLDQNVAQLSQDMDKADTDRQDVPSLAKLTGAWAAYVTWRDTKVFAAVDAGRANDALDAYRTDNARMSDAVTSAAVLRRTLDCGWRPFKMSSRR
jgi:CHASE3 domain sensor protein